MFYTVCVNQPEAKNGIRPLWPYPVGFFPRRVVHLKDAKKIAQEAIHNGATMVRIEYPDGAELDIRPMN